MNDMRAVTNSPAVWCVLAIAAIAICLSAGSHAMWIDTDVFTAPDDLHWLTEDRVQMAWTQEPVPSPYTVRSVVSVQSNITALDAIRLVRLADDPGVESPALDIVWQPDPMSWGATWVLQFVRFDAGTDSVSTHTLGRIRPQAGHTYETFVSTHPESGSVSVLIRDLTDDAVLVRRAFPFAPGSTPLRAGVGFTAKSTLSQGEHGPVTVSSLETSAQYVPVGMTLHVGAVDPQTDTLVPVRRFDLDDTVVIDIEGHDATLPGTLQLMYRNHRGETELARWTQADAPIRFSLPALDLPLGDGSLALEYINRERVLLAESHNVHIGQVNVHLDKLTIDAAENQLVGTARLTSVVPVQDVELNIQAMITQWIWDNASREYTQSPYMNHTILDGAIDIPGLPGIEVPIAIPMPADPGTWEVTFELAGSVFIEVTEAGGRKLFSTSPDQAQESPEHFKVCTYNMLGFQGWPQEVAAKELGDMTSVERRAHFARVIDELSCDILGIQEGRSLDWLGQLARVVNVESARFPSPTAFPGAVFSRYPILDRRDFSGGLHPAGIPFSRTAGSALLDVNGRLLWVVNIHAHPTQFDLREAEAAILSRHLDELLNVTPHVIVLGDFNSQPGTAIHNALRELGFVSTMDLAGTGPRHTVTNLHGIGVLAIDFIYVSPSLMGTVEVSWVVSDPGFRMPNFAEDGTWVHSDHLPVAAEIAW